MPYLKDIRKTWVPLIKIAASSGADIVGDWVFYDRISKDTDAAVEKYELPLFIFFIVSCIMGALTIFTLFCKGCCPRHQQSSSSSASASRSMPGGGCFTLACIARWINLVLSLEIILEDIPQFILTSFVIYEKGLLTPSAVFNITTSAFNFLFNIIDMITPNDDDDDGDKNGGDGQQMETETRTLFWV